MDIDQCRFYARTDNKPNVVLTVYHNILKGQVFNDGAPR